MIMNQTDRENSIGAHISLAQRIDHTNLKPTATETDIRKLCEEAWINGFKSICVAPTYVPYVREMMEFCPTKIEVCTVVGFPMGYHSPEVKLLEAEQAIRNGATEIDVIMNLSKFKSMAYMSVRHEIEQLVQMAHSKESVLKVIIETAYLDSFELHTACEICAEAGADFVKTSTGFAPQGADLDTVRLMRGILPSWVKIKASGGIQTYQQALDFVAAGADRIGTSAGVAMLLNQPQR